MRYKLLNPVEDWEYHNPIVKVMKNRGFTSEEEINHYLNVTELDVLDPFLINNIEEGVNILIDCIVNEKNMFIVPDVDADGFTSAAILINYIYTYNKEYALNHIRYSINPDKTHGIILESVPEDIYLAVYPDSASNDYEQHKILKEKGIKVLIIDHHEAEYVSSDACIINNQLCDYPTKSLSGAGMVYKFCQALDKKLGINNANLFLDLAAVGMVGDMVSLKDFETHFLIEQGISHLRNPFISKIREQNNYSIGDQLTPLGIAFYITPYINATIRIGSESEKQTLFEAMLDFKAYTEIKSNKRGTSDSLEPLVEQACRNCTNIKNKQARARDASLKRIEEKIEETNLNNNKILTVVMPEEDLDKNLTGLIANQLMAKYKKPVLLFRASVDSEGNTKYSGSARGVGQSEFNDLKSFCNDSGYFSLAQGHAQAFGIEIEPSNLEKFNDYSNQQLQDTTFDSCYNVDFILQKDCPQDLVLDISTLKSLYGTGIEESYIAIENITVTKDNLTLMSPDKKPTLKIVLPSGCNLIRFKSSREEYESLLSTGCVKINVVGKCNRNVFYGKTTAQIIIDSYEIVGEQSYYF